MSTACTWQPHSNALYRPLAIINSQKLELVTELHAYTQTLDWNSYQQSHFEYEKNSERNNGQLVLVQSQKGVPLTRMR